MAKLFKTHEEQIEILKKRGMSIPNEKYATTILAHENYYSVINGYKDLFIATTSPDDHYKANVSFNEIVALYSFDRRIRELLLIELLRIERSIRTKIIYVFSSQHGHNHTSYLKQSSFNIAGDKNLERVNILICDLNSLIAKYQNKHNAISHYMRTHKYVPLWVLSNVMTFGKLNSFYSSMLFAEKSAIASDFGLSPGTFKSLIDVLAEFRNKCAHGERVYCHSKDRCVSRPIPRLDIHQTLNIPSNPKGYKYGTQDVLALLIAMKFFLPKERYRKLIENIDYTLHKKLSKRLNSISIDDVKTIMGLNGNWTILKNI